MNHNHKGKHHRVWMPRPIHLCFLAFKGALELAFPSSSFLSSLVSEETAKETHQIIRNKWPLNFIPSILNLPHQLVVTEDSPEIVRDTVRKIVSNCCVGF